MQKEAYKPVWHSQPQLSVSAGSPHLLGCGHVWAWPPELLAPSQPWWAPPYTHSCPARVSAIYDGCPQSSKPSEWTLTKTKNGSEYLVYACMYFILNFQTTTSTYGAQCFHWEHQLVPAGFQKRREDWSQQSPCPPVLQMFLFKVCNLYHLI